MKINKAKAFQDYVTGCLEGEHVSSTKKLFKDAKSLYENSQCELADDTLMYEVLMCANEEPDNPQSLNWGVSVLNPVSVNGQCNMTRGHFHADTHCSEIYFGLVGTGLLLYMNAEGVCFAETVEAGSVHYISGTLAHRLINTGDDVLKVGACWSLQAGYDYERVEKHPFKVKVFKENGEIKIKEDN